jgi:sterol-4alpha-carboxylate 3-dehydrogenase (decarboxylating)
MESYAVIGGEGFFGGALIKRLLELHPTSAVASLGLTQRTFSPPSYRFFHTDITSLESIDSSLRNSGATVVFHTASPHATASKELCESVNVVGTRAVIQACRQAGVKKLIFTSSMTVCYEGEDMRNVDERIPFTDKQNDWYVATKVRAQIYRNPASPSKTS